MPPKTQSNRSQVSETQTPQSSTNTAQAAMGAMDPPSVEGPNQPIDIDHAMLLEVIEDAGISVSYSYSTNILI